MPLIAEPEKGRFRSFLLLALKRYMANERDHARREKRGGGKEIISLDEQNTELRYKAEPADEVSPEKAYGRPPPASSSHVSRHRLGA